IRTLHQFISNLYSTYQHRRVAACKGVCTGLHIQTTQTRRNKWEQLEEIHQARTGLRPGKQGLTAVGAHEIATVCPSPGGSDMHQVSVWMQTREGPGCDPVPAQRRKCF